MNNVKKTFVLILVFAIASFSLTGCKDKAKHEHPTGEHPSKETASEEHPASEHPASEHPAGEHPE